MFAYEVTIEFETKLFARSRLTMQVASMSDVSILQSDKRQKECRYRFVGYRGPTAVVSAESVINAMDQEREAHAKAAAGG